MNRRIKYEYFNVMHVCAHVCQCQSYYSVSGILTDAGDYKLTYPFKGFVLSRARDTNWPSTGYYAVCEITRHCSCDNTFCR